MPFTKGQYNEKCFHVMSSSWATKIHIIAFSLDILIQAEWNKSFLLLNRDKFPYSDWPKVWRALYKGVEFAIHLEITRIDIGHFYRIIKSPAIRLFLQRFAHANNKVYTKAPNYWPFMFPFKRASNTESNSISRRHRSELVCHWYWSLPSYIISHLYLTTVTTIKLWCYQPNVNAIYKTLKVFC